MRPEPDTLIAIGLGSNLGDRIGHLRSAATGLEQSGEIVARSSIWETAPIGPDQPDYLNAAVLLDSVLGPMPLLTACHRLEQAAGRRRRERWGPRQLDLDILLYGDATIDGEHLRIPHPRLHERRFALAPVAEIWPDAEVPNRGRVEDLLATVTDQEVTLTDLTLTTED